MRNTNFVKDIVYVNVKTNLDGIVKWKVSLKTIAVVEDFKLFLLCHVSGRYLYLSL